ncbi:hypothetical protein GCM10007939_13320 [Amylibacter marinus]|uniref:DUF2062 domain-containing protein n=1 Tax=Amylibacter marinus TaxID=1475483 RepID=A0ABQ5VUP2_9RHOB|nr:DUF2062 domain-containing protein [Amylibacter marinus]GLQ35049.1 hypothetical protein GCM10007939_13320 [Amylibacter marinus]
MFKRRNPVTLWQWFKEGFYPKAGWRRVLNYVGHRVKRLPDTPHRIALGFSCGAFVCFSPLFGLHFFLAAGLAYVLRGNVLSSLIGTFFGNPITFPFIGAISYSLGQWMTGNSTERNAWRKARDGLVDFAESSWANVKSIFGYGPSRWDGFVDLFHDFMVPYFIGGLIPGFITALVMYFTTKPLVAAYQQRRKKYLYRRLKERLAKKTDTVE